LDADAIMDHYTDIIIRLNSLASLLGVQAATVGEVEKDIVSQKLLSEMITYLGILRSDIYNNLYYPQRQSLKNKASVYAMYQSLEQEFLIKATPEAVSAYEEKKAQTNLKNTF